MLKWISWAGLWNDNVIDNIKVLKCIRRAGLWMHANMSLLYPAVSMLPVCKNTAIDRQPIPQTHHAHSDTTKITSCARAVTTHIMHRATITSFRKAPQLHNVMGFWVLAKASEAQDFIRHLCVNCRPCKMQAGISHDIPCLKMCCLTFVS